MGLALGRLGRGVIRGETPYIYIFRNKHSNRSCSLWSRLILHFWALEVEADMARARLSEPKYKLEPVECLERAFELTKTATSKPNKWQGTSTVVGAQLHFHLSSSDSKAPVTPLLYVTNLGDSQVLVIRPREQKVLYKSTEQWHWFDCPRQLGTNSPDTPRNNAAMDTVEIEENDVVLAMSDGVIDNLWEHEIVSSVINSIQRWESGQISKIPGDNKGAGMRFVAEELMRAARVIAQDPYAECPFMERAVEDGLAMEGGEAAQSFFGNMLY